MFSSDFQEKETREMEKKLLLAIDGSKNSLEALEYAGAMLKNCETKPLVLIPCSPAIPPIYKGTMDPYPGSILSNGRKSSSRP